MQSKTFCQCGNFFDAIDYIPKILPCGHQRCLECLKSNYKKEGLLRCIYDQQTFYLNPNALPSNQLIQDSFQKEYDRNMKINYMLQNISSQNQNLQKYLKDILEINSNLIQNIKSSLIKYTQQQSGLLIDSIKQFIQKNELIYNQIIVLSQQRQNNQQQQQEQQKQVEDLLNYNDYAQITNFTLQNINYIQANYQQVTSQINSIISGLYISGQQMEVKQNTDLSQSNTYQIPQQQSLQQMTYQAQEKQNQGVMGQQQLQNARGGQKFDCVACQELQLEDNECKLQCNCKICNSCLKSLLTILIEKGKFRVEDFACPACLHPIEKDPQNPNETNFRIIQAYLNQNQVEKILNLRKQESNILLKQRERQMFGCCVCGLNLDLEKECCTLNCDYQICHDCLRFYFESLLDQGKFRVEDFVCPVCNHPIEKDPQNPNETNFSIIEQHLSENSIKKLLKLRRDQEQMEKKNLNIQNFKHQIIQNVFQIKIIYTPKKQQTNVLYFILYFYLI